MIQLFKVQTPVVDTRTFSNLLHDKIKTEVEEKTADYVGAKYSVTVSSATDAIFLSLKQLGENVSCTVPSLVTTRFLNAISYSGNDYEFTDDTKWVGHEYVLYESNDTRIIDSAQRFDKNQYCNECKADDVLIFSNYPTKPLGGLSGGIVVSDNKEKIEWIRQASRFGEDFHTDSWKGKSNFKGYQMFMNSVEAYFVNEAFKEYPDKIKRLEYVRNKYCEELGDYVVTGDSNHLFRIYVKDNLKFMRHMMDNKVIVGIHYHPAHLNQVYNYGKAWPCINSEYAGKTVASIPFHDGLTDSEIKQVIKLIKQYYKENKI